MSLNNASADACGTAINNAIQALSQANKENTALVWQTAMRVLYTQLKANAVITLAASTVVTTGNATTQTGPAAPVILPLT